MIEVKKLDLATTETSPTYFWDYDGPAPRYFHDYNAAVIQTMEEYAAKHIRLNDVDVHEILTKVAQHMFGYTEDTCKEAD